MLGKTTFRLLAIAAVLATAPTTSALAVDSNVAIQDPVSGTNARVDLGRRQHVFDDRATADKLQAQFVRFFATTTTTCAAIASPPTGRSLIVKSLFVNTYQNPTPGIAQNVSFYTGATCLVTTAARVNPGGVGTTALSLEPGLVVPAGQSLWAINLGSVQAEVYGTGYTVPYAWAPSATVLSAPAQDAGQQAEGQQRLGNGD